MENFSFVIYSDQDIPAALREGLKECGSLKASRKSWARLIEALGVDVYFEYLKRKDGERPLSVVDAAQAILAEAIPEESETHPRRATLGDVNEDVGIVEFCTPNGVTVRLIGCDLQVLSVGVFFNRYSTFLSTMMLAGFARRIPAAYPLLAEAAAELAATRK